MHNTRLLAHRSLRVWMFFPLTACESSDHGRACHSSITCPPGALALGTPSTCREHRMTDLSDRMPTPLWPISSLTYKRAQASFHDKNHTISATVHNIYKTPDRPKPVPTAGGAPRIFAFSPSRARSRETVALPASGAPSHYAVDGDGRAPVARGV